VSGGHLRDWEILNLLNGLGIRPHVLYFQAGENYDLPPENPVNDLVTSLSYGGQRIENPDKGLTDKVRRKLKYLKSVRDKNFLDIERDFPFSYQYDAMGAGKIILKHAGKVQAKVIILRSFWCHYTQAMQKEGMKVIVNCPDYNTNLAREMVKCAKNPLKKVGPICNYFGVRTQERTYLDKCDEIWVPTEEERQKMASFISKDKLLLFPNLIDVASNPDFSGDYTPNANAAKVLLKQIFPTIKQHYHEAKLYLVGKGLSPDLKKLSKEISGVETPGFVPDVNKYFKMASIFVSPVREGAGMLFKVIEALSLGKAVVGFTESFRGIPDGNTKAFASANSDREFVSKVLEMLSIDSKRISLGRNARAFAEKELSWERGKAILSNCAILKHLNRG
jgi:hypothetical protein